ncbi:MAG: hypothetical protein JW919_04345 [Candidatus Omnitrophica bacterium]|nr:hypothetical protein [Candidatus Omnitrophota bacterium]
MSTAVNLKTLQDTLGHHFKDEALLFQALTHSSFAYESKDKGVVDNNRLEFLGDSILGMVIAGRLYRKHPDMSEGELTQLRSSLVNRDHLSEAARRTGLDHHLLLGKGEEKTGGRSNASNLSGAIEAVVAAVYLDGGLEAAERFITGNIIGEN